MPIKRINIAYDGASYSIGNREYDEVKAEIESFVESGRPHWLRVNHGEGSFREVDLLITPSTSISLSAIDPASAE
ncbi:hypothetical protein [Planctomonas psychrotolerans]|uniref:hypothetical protein n=1 Tax=Planctomonas psychrotolerans TaxID=2528712 RepID=UPI00123BC28D|nr:hypothetical protein [Planctomonas psychrotolerans]